MGPNFSQTLYNNIFYAFRLKSQNLWSGFWDIAPQSCRSGKFDQFGPKTGHTCRVAPIIITVLKFSQALHYHVFHAFHLKSQNVWTDFWVIGHQIGQCSVFCHGLIEKYGPKRAKSKLWGQNFHRHCTIMYLILFNCNLIIYLTVFEK